MSPEYVPMSPEVRERHEYDRKLSVETRLMSAGKRLQLANEIYDRLSTSPQHPDFGMMGVSARAGLICEYPGMDWETALLSAMCRDGESTE